MTSEATRSSGRLIATEPQSPAWQAALEEALLEVRKDRTEPPTFVSTALSSRCILLGACQSADPAELEQWRQKGIDVRRRRTGGTAVLIGPDQFSFSLFLPRPSSCLERVKQANETMIAALKELGFPVEATLRGADVRATKIGWLTSMADDRTLLIQGFVYVRNDEGIRRLLNEETTTLWEVGAGAAPAIEEVRTAFGRRFAAAFGISPSPGTLTNEERAHLASRAPALRQEEMLQGAAPLEGVTSEALLRSPGGVLKATATHGQERNRIRRVVFSGDFCAHPSHLVGALMRALTDIDIAQAPDVIEEVFGRLGGEVTGFTSGDFFTALSLAFMRRRLAQSAAPDPAEWKNSPA